MTERPAAPPFLGIISAEIDPPGIDRANWEALIISHHALHPTGGGSANIVLEGAEVGRIAWCTTGGSSLDVHGDEARAPAAAAEIALALAGRFVSLEELTTC